MAVTGVVCGPVGVGGAGGAGGVCGVIGVSAALFSGVGAGTAGWSSAGAAFTTTPGKASVATIFVATLLIFTGDTARFGCKNGFLGGRGGFTGDRRLAGAGDKAGGGEGASMLRVAKVFTLISSGASRVPSCAGDACNTSQCAAATRMASPASKRHDGNPACLESH